MRKMSLFIFNFEAKIFIRNALFFVIFCLLILYPVSKVYDIFFRNTAYWDLNKKQLWILSKTGGGYDFAVLGSSRVLTMVDINTIEQETELRGINLGANGSGYAENYLLLKKFIENKNNISTLLINVDVYGFNSANSYSYPFHDYLFIPLLREDDVAEIFKDNISPLKYYLWRYIPFARYVEFNHFYSIFKMLSPQHTAVSIFDKTKGTLLGDKFKGFKKLRKKVYNINDNDYNYFIKIIEFARKSDICIILFSAPEYFTIYPYQINRDMLLKRIKSTAKELTLPYFDHSDDSICNHKEFFRDYTHLNSMGSKRFSRLIAIDINKSVCRYHYCFKKSVTAKQKRRF